MRHIIISHQPCLCSCIQNIRIQFRRVDDEMDWELSNFLILQWLGLRDYTDDPAYANCLDADDQRILPK